jgi:hypothetical protein
MVPSPTSQLAFERIKTTMFTSTIAVVDPGALIVLKLVSVGFLYFAIWLASRADRDADAFALGLSHIVVLVALAIVAPLSFGHVFHGVPYLTVIAAVGIVGIILRIGLLCVKRSHVAVVTWLSGAGVATFGWIFLVSTSQPVISAIFVGLPNVCLLLYYTRFAQEFE